MDNANHRFAFQKLNYKFLLIGLAINIVGFLLMIGGESTDPNKFDASALFSASPTKWHSEPCRQLDVTD